MPLPPVIFEVSFVVPAEMRWAMRAKGVIDDWLMSDAAGERPVDQLPSADLQMAIDHSELKLSWLELRRRTPGRRSSARRRSSTEIIPELLRTRSLRVDAGLQGPDPELRRPLGA